MEDYFICILGIGLLLAIAYGSKWWEERPWYKAGVKKPGPLSISKEAYRRANQHFETPSSSINQEELEEMQIKRSIYMDYGKLAAETYKIAKYETFDFPVRELFARIKLAYDIQTKIDGYPKELTPPNVPIGMREYEEAKVRLEQFERDVNQKGYRRDQKREADKYFANRVIQDLRIGPYKNDLTKLGKQMYFSDAFMDTIMFIYYSFKKLEIATVRTVKEKY